MITKYLAATREVGLFQGFDLPPKIVTLYRADFDDDGYVTNQFQLDVVLQLWLPTHAVADFVYLGEGNFQYVDRHEIDAYFASVFPDWQATTRPGRIALARQLEDLTDENPSLVYDFYFAQWSKSPHDCAYFQVQLDSPDQAAWWVEFSSDRFNSPHLTPKQREAIDEAGFDEPVFAAVTTEDLSGDMLHYSPNHHKYMRSASADQVVDVIRGVLIQGFGALGFGGKDDLS